MTSSLEVRWFLPGAIPKPVRKWFRALGDPTEPEVRTDRYLIPAENEDLGLKVREGRVEVKQRSAVGDVETWGAATACPETWHKWPLGKADETPPTPRWVDVSKTRRQFWVRVDDATGALELTEVDLDGQAWWSICLEASGEKAKARKRVFKKATSRWLDRPDAPTLPLEAALAYPAWLLREVG